MLRSPQGVGSPAHAWGTLGLQGGRPWEQQLAGRGTAGRPLIALRPAVWARTSYFVDKEVGRFDCGWQGRMLFLRTFKKKKKKSNALKKKKNPFLALMKSIKLKVSPVTASLIHVKSEKR